MSDFDVIVVGAGGAGGPLAARLSEDPDRRVLLVEAGPAPGSLDEFPADLLNPGLMTGYMPGHPQSWSHPAQLIAGKPHSIARGKILGGSTSLNGTYFIRARRRDFEDIVALGNDEWSYEKVLPFYRRLENDLDFGDESGHSVEGPVPVSRPSEQDLTTYTRAFIDACRAAGYAWERDKNSEDGETGVGLLPTNSKDGIRMSTGLTHVNPARTRPNLTVRAETLARKVTFEGTQVTGIEVERDGVIETVKAPQVVLAAGAFKSPHLLALSGVGPQEELAEAGIDVVVDLPGVGKNFSDHPSVPINWTPKRRLDEDDLRFAFQVVLHVNTEDSNADGNIEILPMMPTMMALIGLERGEAIDLTLNVSAQVESRGEITIVSADPHVQPRIEYHYLESAADRKRLRAGVRIAADLLHSESFEPLFERFVNLDEAALPDDQRLDEWIRSVLDTAIHSCASCRMGSVPATGDVVDQFGRVHGVTGLRVADTSILPFTPSRGPAASAMAIGERIADMLIEDESSQQAAVEVLT